jgi:hypothetical protein
VGDTENVMRQVCEFLDISFDPAVTALHSADRSAVFKGKHHTLARGNSIVSTEGRHQALPPALADKIAGYRAYWKARNGDRWLLSKRFSETSTRQPNLWRRAADHLLYKAFRIWDVAPRAAFSVLPLSAWRFYRRIKYKDAFWVHRQLTEKKTTLNIPSARS